MKSSIVQGVKIKNNVPEVLDAMQQAKARILEKLGGKAETYAKRQCPVDTGNLRNSITHKQLDENTEIIGSNVEYAPYVELGTVKMRAQPYLRPAVENHWDEYKKIIHEGLKNVK